MAAAHDSCHGDTKLVRGSSGRVHGERERWMAEAAVSIDQGRSTSLVENRRLRSKVAFAAKRQLFVSLKLPEPVAGVPGELGIDDMLGNAGGDGRRGTPAKK